MSALLKRDDGEELVRTQVSEDVEEPTYGGLLGLFSRILAVGHRSAIVCMFALG